MYLLWLCFLVIIKDSYGQFQIPPIEIEAFTPSGIRARIQAVQGMELFGFHGKINEKFKQLEPGHFTKDTMDPENGYFVYDNPNLRIKVGDVIHYWIFVQHLGLGYRVDNLSWIITELKVRSSVSSCSPSKTKFNDKKDLCKGAVLFEDEFDGNSLDASKWIWQQYIPTAPDFEFNIYTKESSITLLRSDKLTIKPKLRLDDVDEEWLDLDQGCTPPPSRRSKCKNRKYLIQQPVASGKIVSTTNFSYGEVEIRAKLPSGDWLYPQIYLEDDNFKKIIIAYARGNSVLRGNDNTDLGGSLLFGGPAIDDNEPKRSSNLKSVKKSNHLSDDFHIYKIKWLPEQIELFLDGARYGLVSSETLESTGFGNGASKVHLVLGVGVGGGTDFPDNFQGDYPKPWRNSEAKQMKKFYDARDSWYPTWQKGNGLEVEYVRISAI